MCSQQVGLEGFMNTEFLRPRLVGKRFAAHTVPLDLLKDFSAFEEMLLEIAKRNYFAQFPDRKRLPKGFGKNISINLAAVDHGSAILALTLSSHLAAATLIPSIEEDYFNQAKDAVIETIALVEQGKDVLLDPVLLRYFDRFGRSLKDDESIEFALPEGKATLNHKTRKRLLEISKVKSWSEDLTLKGYVSAVDKNNQTFDLELINTSKIKSAYLEQYQHVILEAFDGYEDKALIEVKGVAILDRSGLVKNFETLEQVTLLDPLDIEARLEELSLLENGWLNGKGKALNKEKAKLVSEYFYSFYSDSLPLPYLYPTAEGGLQAEWEINDWDISLEIDLEKLIAELHALNLQSDEEKGLNLILSEKNSWQQMNEMLESFSKEQA